MPGMGPMGPGGGPGGFGGPHGGPHGFGGPMGPMGGPMGPMGRSALGPGFYGGLYAQKGTGPVVEDDSYKVETRTVKYVRDDGTVETRIEYVNREYERWRHSLRGRITLWFRRVFRLD